MTRTDVYVAVTPFGALEISFPEEGGCTMGGPDLAREHLRSVMSAAVKPLGLSITEGNMEPRDLVMFCQPAGSGVSIIEPFDDVLELEPEDDGEPAEAVLDGIEHPALAAARASSKALAASSVGLAAEPAPAVVNIKAVRWLLGLAARKFGAVLTESGSSESESVYLHMRKLKGARQEGEWRILVRVSNHFSDARTPDREAADLYVNIFDGRHAAQQVADVEAFLRRDDQPLPA